MQVFQYLMHKLIYVFLKLRSLVIYFFYRYLLRRSALELFMIDRSNFFFDFGVSLSTVDSHYPNFFFMTFTKFVYQFDYLFVEH